jgi:FixJ family two-component response regulator
MSDPMLVAIVDDDESMRYSLPVVLKQLGFRARAFTSAEEFLASDCVSETRCLILDVAMPGMSGPDLQRELSRRGQKIPIVFITGQLDQDLRRQLLADGAVECLFKPFGAAALREALNTALGVS